MISLIVVVWFQQLLSVVVLFSSALCFYWLLSHIKAVLCTDKMCSILYTLFHPKGTFYSFECGGHVPIWPQEGAKTPQTIENFLLSLTAADKSNNSSGTSTFLKEQTNIWCRQKWQPYPGFPQEIFIVQITNKWIKSWLFFWHLFYRKVTDQGF